MPQMMSDLLDPGAPRARTQDIELPTGPLGKARGVVVPGNVDLYAQPEVRNPDGSTSTVHSASYNIDGREVLLPTVTPDGRHLRNDDEIVAEFYKTGRHLGIFESPDAATAYAAQLHRDYEAGKYRARKR